MEWTNFAEVRATFTTTDRVGKYTVFDIGGNNYRVIAEINYTEEKCSCATCSPMPTTAAASGREADTLNHR